MMTSTAHEIPMLLVVVPLGTALLAVTLWLLHRRAALTVPRFVTCAALCTYACGIVANTLLPFYVGQTGDRPNWSVFLNLVPLVDTEWMDMLQNVIVFLPLGFLLPVIFGVDSARRVLLYGFLLSLAMEMLQLVNAGTGHGGHIADVNDLLANTVGGLVGYGIFRGALSIPRVARPISAASWPPRTHRFSGGHVAG